MKKLPATEGPSAEKGLNAFEVRGNKATGYFVVSTRSGNALRHIPPFPQVWQAVSWAHSAGFVPISCPENERDIAPMSDGALHSYYQSQTYVGPLTIRTR